MFNAKKYPLNIRIIPNLPIDEHREKLGTTAITSRLNPSKITDYFRIFQGRSPQLTNCLLTSDRAPESPTSLILISPSAPSNHIGPTVRSAAVPLPSAPGKHHRRC